jgi:hypothetical protein
MTKENKSLNITFAPGCFDNFEGTQEELDALVNEIKNLTLEDLKGQSVEFSDDFDYEEIITIDNIIGSKPKGTLH